MKQGADYLGRKVGRRFPDAQYQSFSSFLINNRLTFPVTYFSLPPVRWGLPPTAPTNLLHEMNAASSHTTGPWEAHGSGSALFVYAADSKLVPMIDKAGKPDTYRTRLIALVYGTYPETGDDDAPKGSQAANAQLIAAAPRMLHQLYMLLPYLEQLRDDEAKSSDPTYRPGVLSSLVEETSAVIAQADGHS